MGGAGYAGLLDPGMLGDNVCSLSFRPRPIADLRGEPFG